MRIHQFIPYLHAPGDAAADQVYAFQQAFHGRGFESEIYALDGDPDVAGVWRPASAYDFDREPDGTVLLYHYVIGSPMTAMLKSTSGRLILYYHSITPPEFVAPFHRGVANSMEAGREELRTLCHIPAIAASDYSRRELVGMGFEQVSVVPLVLDFDRLHASAETPVGRALVEQYVDGRVNWVTVGRVAPNKRCEDILKAFAYYHQLIDPTGRLFFVGGYRHFEGYQFNLRRMAEGLGVADNVHWCGWVPYDRGFGAYYRLASVFVYMSEHEGFCMPLLEAMSFDVPVIAYGAAAIPSTMGDGGILFKRKRYEAIASLVDLLHGDMSLRRRLIAAQRRRLAQFASEDVLEKLVQTVREYARAAKPSKRGHVGGDDVANACQSCDGC
jgi:glycosyltransferase involved in cell wall biosynthesis